MATIKSHVTNHDDKATQLKTSSIGYELLGDIAIIEFRGSKKDELLAAKNLIKNNKRIKTVLAKAGPVSGKYRTRKLRHVCGTRNYVAHYKESNCDYVFDVRKAFFSSKLSFERSRVSKQVGNKENVMVMFSGVGPFAIIIAKEHRSAKLVGIEANPTACKYMLENVKLNRLSNVEVVKGDVKKKCRPYTGFADRIIMPLPWSSLDFLDEALLVAKRRAVVHIYLFGKTDSVLSEAWKKIREHAKRNLYTAKKTGTRIVRTYSPTESEIVIDYTISKNKKARIPSSP